MPVVTFLLACSAAAGAAGAIAAIAHTGTPQHGDPPIEAGERAQLVASVGLASAFVGLTCPVSLPLLLQAHAKVSYLCRRS